MVRIAASEESRIRSLNDALHRAINRDMIGECVGQGPMCDLLGVKPATLRGWLDEFDLDATGAYLRGGRGVDYRFDPIATIWVLIRAFENKRDERVQANLRIREMVAGDKLADVPAEMTVKEVRDALQLHLQILSAEKESGALVDANASAVKFRELVLALRDTLLSAPQKLDPTNTWSAEFRESVDNALADCMVLLRQSGIDTLTTDDEILPGGSNEADKPSSRRRGAGKSK